MARSPQKRRRDRRRMPARDESAKYVSYANSIAVDPMGRVLARAGEEQTILFAEADREAALSVRKQIPVGKKPADNADNNE